MRLPWWFVKALLCACFLIPFSTLVWWWVTWPVHTIQELQHAWSEGRLKETWSTQELLFEIVEGENGFQTEIPDVTPCKRTAADIICARECFLLNAVDMQLRIVI